MRDKPPPRDFSKPAPKGPRRDGPPRREDGALRRDSDPRRDFVPRGGGAPRREEAPRRDAGPRKDAPQQRTASQSRKPQEEPREPKQGPPDNTFEEALYLKTLIANKTPVRVKLLDNQEVAGVVEYYDASFIRLTRDGEANLFIYKKDIKYLEELAAPHPPSRI